MITALVMTVTVMLSLCLVNYTSFRINVSLVYSICSHIFKVVLEELKKASGAVDFGNQLTGIGQLILTLSHFHFHFSMCIFSFYEKVQPFLMLMLAHIQFVLLGVIFLFMKRSEHFHINVLHIEFVLLCFACNFSFYEKVQHFRGIMTLNMVGPMVTLLFLKVPLYFK